MSKEISKRWKGYTEEEKRRVMRNAAISRWSKASAEQRKEQGRKMMAGRIAKQ